MKKGDIYSNNKEVYSIEDIQGDKIRVYRPQKDGSFNFTNNEYTATFGISQFIIKPLNLKEGDIISLEDKAVFRILKLSENNVEFQLERGSSRSVGTMTISQFTALIEDYQLQGMVISMSKKSKKSIKTPLLIAGGVLLTSLVIYLATKK